ncbi:cytochrome c551 [Salsuginibacillus halophilus]|uniref:Cytochrome c551 n=1 Tax=Salsuginibacillus halophilus TaxID=517424 RepID=A0A2P8H995_9BACI|nr:cytochrome c [Salsuginibacillus halophilus]PSL42739.1 cytochrome c551 [Salsuginibacillus halophilus]
MKKYLLTIGAAALVLSACGTDEAGEPQDPVAENGEEEAADDDNGDEEEADDDGEGETYDADEMEAVYEQNCLSCHGENLEGDGGNPGIQGLDEDSVHTAIEEGPGAMPADLVEGEEAEELSAWVADQ